jgi:hypothetical protein
VILLLSLLGCGSSEPAWALHHGSVVPTSTGLAGTQVWEFFTERWGRGKEDAAFVCARAQTLTGTVIGPFDGCESCLVVYELAITELDGDCPPTIASNPAFELPVAIGIGDPAPDLVGDDPYNGRSYGWYASFDGAVFEPYGYAWDDALDWGGTAGPPGWNDGQAYTLWPAYAWDLAAPER